MNDEDPFWSPKLMLNRAQENILDFKSRQSAFFDRKPYARIVEIDRQTGHEIHKVRFTAKVPGSISAVVADALNNIRHTLDQTIVAHAAVMGVTGNKLKDIYFPFAADAVQLERAIEGKCKGVHPDVIDYLRGLQPYPDGHALLTTINKLAGTNKHQALAPVGVGAGNSSEAYGFDPKKADEFMPFPHWDGAKSELTLFRKRPGSQHYGRVEFGVHIAFGDNAAKFEGPVWEAINLMGMIVAGILGDVEAITKRVRPNPP